MTRRGRDLRPEELAAIELLTRGHRVLVVLIPEGVPTAEIEALSRWVNGQLDALVAKHDEAVKREGKRAN